MWTNVNILSHINITSTKALIAHCELHQADHIIHMPGTLLSKWAFISELHHSKSLPSRGIGLRIFFKAVLNKVVAKPAHFGNPWLWLHKMRTYLRLVGAIKSPVKMADGVNQFPSYPRALNVSNFWPCVAESTIPKWSCQPSQIPHNWRGSKLSCMLAQR